MPFSSGARDGWQLWDDGVDYDGASLGGGGGRARLCRLPQAQVRGGKTRAEATSFFRPFPHFRRDSAEGLFRIKKFYAVSVTSNFAAHT